MKHLSKSFFTTIFVLFISSNLYAFEVDGIYYKILSDDELAVTSGGYTGDVVIPETVTYNGVTYSVTSIGEYAFYNCSNLTSVTIGNLVTSIGNHAFQDCSNLVNVTMPNSVVSIGNYAFYKCTNLTNVTTPNSVVSIGSYAFYECLSLTSFSIPNSITNIGGDAFYGCSSLESLYFHCKEIGRWFDGNTSIKNVIIGDEVNCIRDYAFLNCSGLIGVSISNSVNSIGNNAFKGCSNLTEVTIPSSVTSIGSSVFYGCSGLKRVSIPSSVTSIGGHAFWGCSSLRSITIPNSVVSIGTSAFNGCSGLTSVIIPNSVINIGDNAFPNTLKKAIWLSNTPPSGWGNAKGVVNYVSNNLFGTSSDIIVYPFLSSIFEVNGIKYVPVSPSERTCDAIDYNYDESLSEVNIKESVSYQGISMKVMNLQPYLFYHNDDLRKVCLDITGSIGKHVFDGCRSLETAELGKDITTIGEYAFNECSKLEAVIVPNSVKAIGKYTFYECSNMTSAIIGNGVQTVEEYTFSGCSNLATINLGNKTRWVQQYAFSGCSSLPNITFPGSVHFVDNYAFNGCKSLKEVAMAEQTGEVVTTLFDDCSLSSNSAETNYSISGTYTVLSFMACEGDEISFDYVVNEGTLNINGDNITPSGPNTIWSGSYKKIIKRSGLFVVSYKLGRACSISNIKLTDSDILAMGSHIFKDCPLDSIFINRKVSNNNSPFDNNLTLRSVVITDIAETIPEKEFFGCINLQNVQIGNGVTTIGDWAFSGCSSLKSFSFGTNVSNIGKEAFSDCTALTELISNATTPPLCGEQALDDIKKWTCKLFVPKGCVGAYQAANQWKEFFFIEEGEKPKAEIAINEENFPDENFRAYLMSQSYGKDGIITEEEIKNVTSIEVNEKNITNLKGIEYFTALTYLSCSNNQLTSLDVSKNTALTSLFCGYNQLTSLDVSKNTALTWLSCSGNQLTNLDVSKNTALTRLSCDDNQLTSLNASGCTALTELWCNNKNQLTSLDVSGCTALTILYCGYNQLTSLDVSKNTALTRLSCSGNQLTNLDVSKNAALTELSCSENQLTSLDVSKNTALTELSCSENQLTSLDVSKNTALTELYCYNNKIKGEAMDALVASLPKQDYGKLYIIDLTNPSEGNRCSKEQVNIAKRKGWTVYSREVYGGYKTYEGSDQTFDNLYIYEVGRNNIWGAIEQPLYSANKDGIYRGFFYAQEAVWTGGKGVFKFTGAFNSWEEGNYGLGHINADGLSGTLIDDGSSANILAAPGFYRANVNLGNMTYELTPISCIGIIGPAQAGGWDTDTDLTYNPETLAWEGTIKLVADQFKFRANDSWDINWGGSINNLTQDDSNLKIDEAGTYFIQFFPLCETKSYATMTLVTDQTSDDYPTSGSCGETVDYFYDKASHTLTISGKGAIYDYDKVNKAPWSSYEDKIQKIEINYGITSIGYFAFYKCSSVTSLSLPATVGYIGSSAFEDCKSLTSLSLNDGLLSIGGSAFEGCAGLKTLSIPSSVNTISINAFKNCKGITDVYCYAEAIPDTHFDAFDATPTEKATLHVPANSVQAYRTSWPWSDFKAIVSLGLSGDANGDGVVDGKDINAIADYIVKGKTEGFNFNNADVNGDQKVNVADIVEIINWIKK